MMSDQPREHTQAAEKAQRWTPTDHPPHSWPIGQPASWRGGHGCPTIECKGEGSQRVSSPASEVGRG